MKQIILLMALLSLLLVSCTSIPVEKQCTADKDCVPNACCHAADAVNKANMPDCSSMLCTSECEPNTLDCGQGELKCVEGECQVILR